jgi:hypothetical protein
MSIYAHVITDAAAKQVEVLRFFEGSSAAAELAEARSRSGLAMHSFRTPHKVGPIG